MGVSNFSPYDPPVRSFSYDHLNYNDPEMMDEPSSYSLDDELFPPPPAELLEDVVDGCYGEHSPEQLLTHTLGRPSKRALGANLGSKGLLNAPGDNNCFLNSAVQVSLLILYIHYNWARPEGSPGRRGLRNTLEGIIVFLRAPAF